MADLFIGIDLGTTGIKAGLFDAAGRTVASASREMGLETPAAGFAEFDADEYVRRAFDAVREVVSAPGGSAAAVRAIGVSSQAQTFVLLDECGRPLRPAISWLDVRAEAEAAELSDVSRRAGGASVNAIASAPKVLWVIRHEPAVAARARRLLLLPDYLLYRLTGRAVTDSCTAGSTGAWDPWELRWSDAILNACRLDRSMVPEVLLPGVPAGPLTAEAAEATGLGRSVIAVVGTNDQYVGALGAGNAVPGCASMALGTSLAIIATSSRRDRVPRGVGVQPHPAAEPSGGPLFALIAFAKTSGVLFRWFRDTFAPGQTYDELFREIGGVAIGAEGASCVPHFSGTATPDFNAAVRGAFSGLTLAHGRAHLARALAESLAFTARDNLSLLDQAVPITDVRAIGGGAVSDVWVQMIADATGFAIVRPETTQAACLGAAGLAMVGAGRFGSVAEAARGLFRPGRTFEPDAAVRGQYDAAYGRYQETFRSLYGTGEETDY